MMQKAKKEHNEKTLILHSQFLYYRRKDAYWPAHTLVNTFLAVVLLASFFVFHYWLALPFAIIILLLLELPRWLDKPRCLICGGSITVKRQRYTYRAFRLEELYAMGRYQEDGAEPMLFLFAASEDKIKSFSKKHQKEQMLVATHYGYDPNNLSEAEQNQVVLTVFLWKKAKMSNPNTAMLCLTERSWAKLDVYRAEHPLPYMSISAPKGGCFDEY